MMMIIMIQLVGFPSGTDVAYCVAILLPSFTHRQFCRLSSLITYAAFWTGDGWLDRQGQTGAF